MASQSASDEGGSARLYAGRLGAKVFLAAGLLTLVNNYIPPVGHLNRPVLNAIGISAVLCGAATWFAPWDRWPRAATVALAPLALLHVAGANLFGGVSSYSYAVYFVAIFAYVGLTQPPRTSLWLAPVALAAYVAPSLLDADAPAIAALSASVTIPVSVVVGEMLSRTIALQRGAQVESARRAELLATLARAGRAVNTLDPDEVLKMVVDGAMALGVGAAEICVYDEEAGVHRSVHPQGLPRPYVDADGIQPITAGIAGRVRRERETVVVADYSGSELAVPELRDAGFRATVAAPIFCEGELAAALTTGVRGDAPIRPEDVEAIELLATEAGRALENARRFEIARRAAERFAELETLKRDFISNISHELRTPLTVIAGVGQTLEDAWDRMSPDVRMGLLGRLNRNAQTLDEIISMLLDFSRLESGKLEVHARPVNLRALCESVAGRIQSLFDHHGLVIDLPRDVVVEADPALLERVLENLLANAAHHTPPGTRVELSLHVSDGSATVAVTDEGPGISAEDLRELGHRFFRGGDPDNRAQRGAGLGLAFSREILRLHDTGLDITSRIGEGSRFSFSVPVETEGLEISTPRARSEV